METPTELPPSKPPLGAHFLIVLITPLVAMAVGFWWISKSKAFELPLLIIGATTMICATILAGRFSRRMSTPGDTAAGLGFFLFFALLAFYCVCFFVGCTAAAGLG